VTASALLGAGFALWLGILASISPCPLATNVAAVSFIGRQFSSVWRVALSGLFYVLGRTLAYLGLNLALVAGLLSAPWLSRMLQKSMNKVLGPILILVGMVLLELLRLPVPGWAAGPRLKEWARGGGIWGAGVLGIVFALSFCPVSAALFFGSLVPLSLEHGSRVIFPLLFGAGTGLPILVIALPPALGVKSLRVPLEVVARAEARARRITGAIFIGAGVYYVLVHMVEAF